MEEDIDYLAPYLARIGSPRTLTLTEIRKVGTECLEEFKQMMTNRANKIQEQFEKVGTLRSLLFVLIFFILDCRNAGRQANLVHRSAICFKA